MLKVRKRIFEIIEKAEVDDTLSRVYDIFMFIVIMASLVPIAFKSKSVVFIYIDYITVSIFIIDYILRWYTADIKLNCKVGFLKYPVTPFAIIDLLAILPSFNVVNIGFRALKSLRAIKVLRIFKSLRYSKNFILIVKVIRDNAKILISLLLCSIFYILVSALFIFSIEPDSFNNFFESIYWATTALTTVGYGDVYPLTDAGRLVSMVSSLFGIAMVALPAGVITAGFIKELDNDKRNDAIDKKTNKVEM